MRCSALKKNCHPCRGFGKQTESGRSLCHIHDEFYNCSKPLFEVVKDNVRLLNNGSKEADWLINAMRSIREQDPKLRESFRQEMIESIDNLHRVAKYFDDFTELMNMYRLFLKGDILEPHDLKRLWKRSVMNRLRLLQFCASETQINDDQMTKLLEESRIYFKGAKAAYTVWYLSYALWELKGRAPTGEGEAKYKKATEEAWKKLFLLALDTVNLQPFVGVDVTTFLDPAMKLVSPENSELQRFIVEAIEERARQKLKEMGTRIEPFKEAFAAAAFRPERVWAALDAGMEIEDM